MDAVATIAERAGIVVRTSPVGGREFSFCDHAVRTIVVHLIESDVPDVMVSTLNQVFSG